MARNENKTRPGEGDVDAFLSAVENDTRREDCHAVMALMREITGEEPVLWGPSIVGFGRYRYRTKAGREGEWFLTGFSPRKQALTLYIMAGFSRYDDLMARLGKFKTGKSCLYVKKLEDVDPEILRELIAESAEYVKNISVGGGSCGS